MFLKACIGSLQDNLNWKCRNAWHLYSRNQRASATFLSNLPLAFLQLICSRENARGNEKLTPQKARGRFGWRLSTSKSSGLQERQPQCCQDKSFQSEGG
jgi:hypothetical protein